MFALDGIIVFTQLGEWPSGEHICKSLGEYTGAIKRVADLLAVERNHHYLIWFSLCDHGDESIIRHAQVLIAQTGYQQVIRPLVKEVRQDHMKAVWGKVPNHIFNYIGCMGVVKRRKIMGDVYQLESLVYLKDLALHRSCEKVTATDI